MNLVVSKPVVEQVRVPALRKHVPKPEEWTWRKFYNLDLTRLSKQEFTNLEAALEDHARVHGVKVLLRDLRMWRDTATKAGLAKARSVKQFEPLLIRYLQPLPHHWVFTRADGDVWIPSYVADIEYHPPQRDAYGERPPSVSMTLLWTEFGGMRRVRVDFHYSDIRGYTVMEALSKQGYVVETPELCAAREEAEV